MDQSSALEVAKRSRGTPRIANRLLRRVRDVAQIKGQGKMSPAIVKEALEMLGINHHGLDALDQRVLTTLIDLFQGGPVGVESLAASLSEERNTLEDVVEPYLIQQGYMIRTSRGRMATVLAYEHLGKPIPDRLKSL
jgi:Holliday junction DNA helicase RuvB